MSRAPLRVAVLGAGTVGLEVIRAFEAFPDRLAPADGAPLRLVGVAVRDLERARARGVPADLLTDAPAHLVASPEVDVLVELMGGDEPARTLTAAALGAGKPVVSANKHVIAHHGPELEAIARRTGAAFRFEAAVGGGTPVLGPLAAELAADRIDAVRGIVNGTTNHILTAMAGRGRAYAYVLAEAQAAGYAEADPSGDVEGDDAVNKLVILARLAFGTWLDPARSSAARRPSTGTGDRASPGVTLDELKAAAAVGLTIKLLAPPRPARGRVDRRERASRPRSRGQPARADRRRPEPDRGRRPAGRPGRLRRAGRRRAGHEQRGPRRPHRARPPSAGAPGPACRRRPGRPGDRPARRRRRPAPPVLRHDPPRAARPRPGRDRGRPRRRVHRRRPPARRAAGRPRRGRRRGHALPGRASDGTTMAASPEPGRTLPALPAGQPTRPRR